MRPILLAASAALIAVVGSAVLILDKGPVADAQTTTNVSIGDNWFCNASFDNGSCDTNVTAGDTVVWTNNGSAVHTVQECDDTFTTCPPPGGFDSGGANPLTNGDTFSHTFDVAGNFEYRCSFHPTQMRGRVTVLAAQQTPTPAPTLTPGTPPTTAPAGAGTATPTPSGLPAAAPATGGTPSEGIAAWVWLVAAIGGAIVVASAVTGVGLLRRR